MILESTGIVLKIFPYSNTSLICNILTKGQGKLTFIAKGVRKNKNPLLSILQPFHLLDLQYYYKKDRSMQLIKEADIINSFDPLRQNFNTLVMGGAILNIINKIFEQEYPNDIIFRLVSKTLNKLSSDNRSNSKLFIFFLFHLSKQLGVMPNIYQCYLCNKLFDQGAIFSQHSQSLVCVSCNSTTNLDDYILNPDILYFLNLINKTNIDDIPNIEISSDDLYKLYCFLMMFMKFHIHNMDRLEGLKQLEKICYA